MDIREKHENVMKQIEKRFIPVESYIAYIDSRLKVYKNSFEDFIISFDKKVKMYIVSLETKFRSISMSMHSIVDKCNSSTKKYLSYLNRNRLVFPVTLSFFAGFFFGLYLNELLHKR